MLTIAVLAQKGGVGKTTLAINLAVAAEKDALNPVIIDLDPQASATKWGDNRKEEYPLTISAQAARLPNIMDTCKKEGADIVLIDTAPHAENAALLAAKVADLIIIPCKPSMIDLLTLNSTLSIAQIAAKSACIILNQTPSRGTLSKEAAEAIKEMGASLCPIEIISRVAFIHAFTDGLGVVEYEKGGKAANEIMSLYRYIKTQTQR